METYAVRRIEIDPDKGDYAVGVLKDGMPVKGVSLNRISRIEERVMEWPSGAPHIHRWIMRNATSLEAQQGDVELPEWQLRDFLEACDRVLSASELEEYEPETEDDDGPPKGTLVIKDASSARSWLPLPSGEEDDDGRTWYYDIHYLRQVEATRDWLCRMLSESGTPGDIHYRFPTD